MDGNLFIWNPYRIFKASQNSFFVRWKSLHFKGKAFNQDDAPFSLVHDNSLLFVSSSLLITSRDRLISLSSLVLLISDNIFVTSAILISSLSFWVWMRSCSCFITLHEFSNWILQLAEGIMMPKPPNLVGKAIKSLSWLNIFLPLKCGNEFVVNHLVYWFE